MARCKVLASFFSLFLAFVARDVFAQTVVKAKVAESSDSLVNAGLNSRVVKATLHCVPVPPGSPVYPSGDDDPDHIFTVVQSLELSVGTTSVWVPRAAFADLLDPQEVSLRFEKGDFILRLAGGDASESYFVDLYFGATAAKQRLVYSSLVPTTPTEVSTYRTVELKDREQ
jgi:hypothetical protein